MNMNMYSLLKHWAGLPIAEWKKMHIIYLFILLNIIHNGIQIIIKLI